MEFTIHRMRKGSELSWKVFFFLIGFFALGLGESPLRAQDVTPPAVPTSFSAVASGSDVNLSWTNPTDGDFDSVTIRRSSSAYPATPASDSSVASNLVATSQNDLSLADGTYFYSIFAKDSSSNFSGAAHATVVVDTATLSPMLTSPASSTSYKTLSIHYSLPEAPLGGSISLTFSKTGTTRTLSMNASQSVNITVDPTLNIPATYAANVVSMGGGGSSIPDGTYSVTLSYQDGLGHGAASASATSVVIDTVTQTPTLTSPATSYSGSSLPISYTFPETALSGSKTITLSNTDRTIILTLKDSALSDFSLDPLQDPSLDSNILSSSATSIPDGTYDVTISYQDVLGNAAATVTHSGVVITHASATTTSGGDSGTSTESTTPSASDPEDGGGGCQLKSVATTENSRTLFMALSFFLVLVGVRKKIKSNRKSAD